MKDYLKDLWRSGDWMFVLPLTGIFFVIIVWFVRQLIFECF